MEELDNGITEPTRVKNFARFFKNYMSIWSVVVAALPIPVTSFNLIPVFTFQKEIFSTYTTLFCFLVLGFIFYLRHRLAKFFFPEYYIDKQNEKYAESDFFLEQRNSKQYDDTLAVRNKWYADIAHKAVIVDALPLFFIVLSVVAAFIYNMLIDNVLGASSVSRNELLKNEHISHGLSTELMICYLGVFIFAETAFILMAIKEYLQDLLHITDESLMISDFKKRSDAAVKMASPPDFDAKPLQQMPENQNP